MNYFEWMLSTTNSTGLQSIRDGYLEWKIKYLNAKEKLEKGIVNIYNEDYGFLINQYDPEKDKQNEKAIIMFHMYADLMKKYNIIPYPNIQPEHISSKDTKNETHKK